MKKLSKIVTFLVLVALASNMLVAAEGDTLVVPAEKEDGTPIVNALIKYVEADTNLDGKQNHDVYRLKRGKYYRFNQMAVFNNPINIVAYEPGDTPETRPPKIMLTTNEEGGIPWDQHIMEAHDNVTLKNIAFSTTTKDMGYNWANLVHLVSPDKKIVMEGCHVTLLGWGILQAYVDGTNFQIDNCHIRNATSTDSWCPFFFETDVANFDSLVCTNTTFFNMVGSVLNADAESEVGYVEFDHNTFANIVRLFNGNTELTDAKITNNVFYNTNTASSREMDITNDDNALHGGSIIDLDTIKANEPGAPDSLVSYANEKNRKVAIKNNAYYWSEEVDNLFDDLNNLADEVDSLEKFHHPQWMSDRAAKMVDNNDTYSGIVAENNINKDPEFTNFGGTDKMINFIKNEYTGGSLTIWGWDPDSAEYPDMHYANLQWPLPEDFSHNLDQKATDGYHLGSLEYYPDEMKEYYTGGSAVENNPANGSNSFELKNNYPNPFNPTTTIDYSLKNNVNVELSVYNVVGQKVKTLVNSTKTSGSHSVKWKGLNEAGQKVSSGIYFYRLKSGSNVEMKKMMLLK